MAFDTKGITIEINGDASGFSKALRSIKTEVSGVDHELGKLARAMKSEFNSGATSASLFVNQQELMKQKYANLVKQQATHQQALEAEKAKLQQLTAQYGEYDSQTIACAQNIDYLNSEMALLSSQMDKLSSGMILGSQSTLRLYSSLGRVSKAAAQAADAIRPLATASTAALAASVASAISFEDAWTGVTKTVEGTPAQMEAINDGLKELATSTASSYQDLAKFAELAGQMGVNTDSIVGFTKTVAMLGDTTNVAGEEAAQALAKIANIMVPVEQRTTDYYERFGSTLVDLGNNFATTEADIVAMSTKLASAGRAVGFTTPQVMALATSLSSLGVQANAGGNSMSKLLNRIQLAVSTGNGDLTSFAETAGMSAQEFSKAWGEDAGRAFEKFIQGLGKTGNVTKALDELGIKEVRMANAVRALAQSSDVLTSAMDNANHAWESNAAMVTEAEKRYATLKSALSQAWEAIKQLGAGIGEALTPTIRSIANGIKDLATWFGQLSPGAKSLAANLLLIAPATWTASKGIEKIANGGQNIIKAFFGINSGASKLASALGIVNSQTGNSAMSIAGLASRLISTSSAAHSAVLGLGAFTAGLAGIATVAAVAKVAGEAFRKNLEEQARAASAANAVNLDLIASSKEYAEAAKSHKETADGIVQSYESEAAEAEILADRITYLNGQENLNSAQKQMLADAVTRLKEIYPDLDISIDSNTGKLQGNTSALDENLEAAKKNAREKALLAATQEDLQAVVNSQLAYDNASRSLNYWNSTVKDASDHYRAACEIWGASSSQAAKELEELGQAQEGQRQALEQYNQVIEESGQYWTDYLTDLMNTGDMVGNISTQFQSEFQQMVSSAEQAGVKIPENIAKGIMDGSADPQAAIAFVSAMLQWNDAVVRAQQAGIDIDAGIVNSILANANGPMEAAQAMQNLITFEQAIEKANLSGVDISNALAQGVANGTITVDEAINQLRSHAGADMTAEGQRSGQTASDGFSAGFGTVSQKISNPLGQIKNAITASGIDTAAKTTADKAAENFKISIDKVPEHAKNASNKATSAWNGGDFATAVNTQGTTAASDFSTSMSNITSSAQSAYDSTKKIVDDILALTDQTYTIKVTKEVKIVESENSGHRSAPARQMLSVASLASEEGVTPTMKAASYASRAVSPITEAVTGAMGYTGLNAVANIPAWLNSLSNKIDRLLDGQSNRNTERYLQTIAENSSKVIVMDNRTVGRLVAKTVKDTNDMSTRLKERMAGAL